MKKLIIYIALAFLSAMPVFSQTTTDIYLYIDSYTNSGSPSTNYGTATSLYVQNVPSAMKTYLQVNFSGIPSYANITKVDLFLTANSLSGASGIVLEKILTPWSESTINYNSAPPATTTGQKLLNLVLNTPKSVDITDWALEWFKNPSSNMGIRISPCNAPTNITIAINSSNIPIISNIKPFIRVTYTLPSFKTISWTNITGGFTVSGTTFSSTSSAGTANSTNVLLPNINGGIVFRPGLSTTTTNNIVGLSDPASPSTILYGLYIVKNGTNNQIIAKAGSTQVGTTLTSVGAKTLCKIERSGYNIIYTIGTNVFTYTGSAADGAKKLVVAANLAPSISITEAYSSFANLYTPVNSSYSYLPSKSTSNNYIFTTTPRVALSSVITTARSTDSYIEDIQYFDGLGRPTESIALLASPTGRDIVSTVDYDDLGRQNITYLPYTRAYNKGAYISTSTDASNRTTFYASGNTNGVPTEAALYLQATTVFEESPLNRVEQTLSPGSAWSTKPVNYDYATNGTDEVIKWIVNTGGYLGNYNSRPYYSPGSLYVTQTTDEDGHTVKEYTDKQGQVIMKDAAGLKTYYVYDVFGLLRYVIPPKAIEQAIFYSNEYSLPSTTQNELIYKYTYDARHRMITKKLPGADEVRMVYDVRDRLVLVQDGKLRSEDTTKWMFTKYDILNRPALTGIIRISGKTVAQIRSSFASETSKLYESASPASNILYTLNNSYPSGLVTVTESDVYTVTYYDSYPSNTITTLGLTYAQLTTDYDAAYSSATINKVTATKVRAVKDAATGFNLTNDFTVTNYFYDKYGRTIGNTSLNYEGLTTKTNSKYDFMGNVLKTQEKILYNSTTIANIAQRFVYDQRNRLLETWHKIGTGTEVLLAQNIYNELGQLKEKHTGYSNVYNDYLQHTDYAYNIRGWLKSINNAALSDGENDLFGEELYYDANPIQANTGYYNGNISAAVWKSTGNNTKSYRFTYDNLNRLLTSNYAEGTAFNSSTDYNNESYTYDANGNITTLVRTKDNVTIDDLSYSYLNLGNKLLYVVDNAPAASKANGFNDRNTGTATDYSYDQNGTLKQDLNKLMNISSNYLNLPSKISCTTAGVTDKIEYLYDAQGKKLAKKVNGADDEEHYMGDVVLIKHASGGAFTLSYLLHSEGVITYTSSSAYVYEYFLKDHLGNTRVKYKDNGSGVASTQQVTDYYPFGMTLAQSNLEGSNKYLYNGKELQDNAINGINLDWYDYGVRMYDAQLGRWFANDPLAELYYSFSPYTYVGNNPIIRIDKFGMDWYTDQDGNYHYNKKLTKKTAEEFFKKRNLVGAKYLGQSATVTVFRKTETEDKITIKAVSSHSLNKDGSVTDLNSGEKLDAGSSCKLETGKSITAVDDRPTETTLNGETFTSNDGHKYQLNNNEWVKLGGPLVRGDVYSMMSGTSLMYVQPYGYKVPMNDLNIELANEAKLRQFAYQWGWDYAVGTVFDRIASPEGKWTRPNPIVLTLTFVLNEYAGAINQVIENEAHDKKALENK